MIASTPVQPNWDCKILAVAAGQPGDTREGAYWCEEVKVPQADGTIRRVNTLFVRDVTQTALDAAVANYVPVNPKKPKAIPALTAAIEKLKAIERERLINRVLAEYMRKHPTAARDEGIALDGDE